MESFSIWPVSPSFLGELVYSRKRPIIFVIYVCTSARISVTPNRQISVKLDIGKLMNISRKIQTQLKSSKKVDILHEDRSTFYCCRRY